MIPSARYTERDGRLFVPQPTAGQAPLYAAAHPVRLWHRREGSGPPVVLLHGLGDSHDLWRHQIGPLAERHHVIAFDLRGHGRSPLGEPGFDIGAMAEDVFSSITELGLEAPTVIGLSLGGGIAQALAIAHPGLVRALVLVSTSSEFPEATRERFRSRAARAERLGMDAVVDATVPRWFTPGFMERAPAEVERTRRTVLATDPLAFAAASRANAVRDLTAGLRAIRCPVLFVAGADDPADPERALATYRRELPNLRWRILPGAAHLVPVERPSAFNAIVLEFLGQLERGNESQRSVER